MISNPIDEQALISKIVNQLSPDLQKALLDIAGVNQALSGVKNDVAGVKSDVGTTAQALTTETNQIDNKLETLTATNGAIDNTATAINQHTTGELDALELALINALNDARDNGKAHTTSINDALETALINAVNGAKSHTTSQHTSTKSALTTSVNSARDNTKSHVTNEVNRFAGSIGIVKSVRNGVGVAGSDASLVVAVSGINPAKCLVTVDQAYARHSGEVLGCWLESLTATQLTLKGWVMGQSIAYQIVEFY